jgi:hypothetical protein
MIIAKEHLTAEGMLKIKSLTDKFACAAPAQSGVTLNVTVAKGADFDL